MLGEVGEDPEGLAGDVVLRRAAPSSILDLKTTSISKPFVVSTKTEQGLLQVTQRWRSIPLPFRSWHVIPTSPTGFVCLADCPIATGVVVAVMFRTFKPP